MTRIFTLAVLLALGCGDPPPSEYPSQSVHLEDTTLGPGDVFKVRVYRQDEMSHEYSVSSEGTISFPLIGTVEVGGKTPAEVERIIRERLADGYLKNPQVSVLIEKVNSKKITVFGEVRTPGTITYSDGMTVIEAVTQAGGFGDLARKNAVTVTRTHNGETKRYTVPVESIGKGKAAQFYMRPGDQLFVPRRVF